MPAFWIVSLSEDAGCTEFSPATVTALSYSDNNTRVIEDYFQKLKISAQSGQLSIRT